MGDGEKCTRPILGYWKIRGLAQAIRLALNYREVDFEDKRYEQGPEPDFSRESWYKEKFSLGLELPNLPYYIDGEYKITEHIAIMNYISRKYNLGGNTEAERIKNDMIILYQKDYRWDWVMMCYGSPDLEKDKGNWLQKLPDKLKTFSELLGENQFLTGDQPLMCDFCVYELLDQLKSFSPGCLDQFKTLTQFCDRVEALPTVKAYINSDRYLKWPFNSKNALWGGDSNN